MANPNISGQVWSFTESADVGVSMAELTSKLLGIIFSFSSILLVLSSLVGCKDPLINAAERGDIATANKLIESGKDIDQYIDGVNPLCAAINKNQEDMVMFLIDNDASTNAYSPRGIGPLHAAAFSGNTNLINVLVQHGANIHAEDTAGQTPLWYAVRRSETAAAQLLEQL